ncbi:MAG: serine/threonine protein kinase, partial [Deltaproteobacteria bacterium]|nr:serine/threonine protein kinase [Deltaproteobacteria bacterium]MBW2531211.1 serine/threonine protein kinase [Deltaproteobacteria bacterium]
MDFPLAEGKVLGDRYHVERLLGAGGMSMVGVALDMTDMSKARRVAIKMLLPDAAKKKAIVQRFEREQRTISQLTNEHAVRFLGGGTEAGFPYMVLEYLEGSDLSEVLKMQGTIGVPEAVEHILQACEAIAEAHALGITHRDLKPGNLFLTHRPDGSTSIKVLDFGISKASGPQRELGETTLTGTAAILGSPFYMSPEQLISSKDVDARTDVWSLGVTLHEILTNTLPFGAKSTQKVCKRILNDKPTPLRVVRPDMPEGLEQIILRSLQRRPRERFANVADFAVRLAEFGPPRAEKSLTVITEFLQPTERVARRVSAAAKAVEEHPVDVPEAPTIQIERAVAPPEPASSSRRTALVAVVYGAAMFGLGIGAGLLIAESGSEQAGATTTAAAASEQPTARADLDPTAAPSDEEPLPTMAELPRELDL